MILANVIIPTLAGHIVVMALLLFPVVALEASVVARRHDARYETAFGMVMRANLKSTFIGIPLGYIFAFLGVIPLGLFAEYLPEKTGGTIQLILGKALAAGGTLPNPLDAVGRYLGIMVVMIPYYLVTLRIERKSLQKEMAFEDPASVAFTVRIMNDVTYGILLIPITAGAIRAVMAL